MANIRAMAHILKIPLMTSVVFFFLLSISGATQDDGAPSYGDTIVVSSIGDARNLIPIFASDVSSAEICQLVYNGLVKYDKDIDLVGDLAARWEVLDGGLTIIFYLKKGVRWHDGAPFTARDVKFTYEKLMDKSLRTPYGSEFEKVKDLEIIDDYTLRINYKEPFAPAIASWSMSVMPEHILKDENLNKTRFSRSPIGTGPFKFKRWKTAEKIELVANDDYFEGRPYIDRYVYRIIPDESTIFLELETEGVDMSGLTPLQWTRQTETDFFKNHFQKFKYPSFGFTYIGYNLLDPKFCDVRVRKALNYAVDKNAIIDTIFFGLGVVTTGPFVINTWSYNNDVKAAPFDPDKARALLKAAGWIDLNGDGIIEKDGKPFEFTLLVNQGNSERLKVAEMTQSYLSAIGIRMKIRVLEWSALINEFIDKKRFEAIILGWSMSRDPDVYDIWHSSKTREGEFNFISYKNEEVDKLLDEGRRTFDQEERAKIYKRVHEIIYDEQPYMFLYCPDALPIVNKRFKNISPAPIGIGYNIIKWFVPKAEQRYRYSM